MKQLMAGLLMVLSLAAGLQSMQPTDAQTQGGAYVEITPSEIQQGRTGMIRVYAPPDVTRAQAVFVGQVIPLYRTVQGDWMGFLAIDMSAERGEALPLDLYMWAGDQAYPPQREAVSVVWGAFDYQNIYVAGSLTHLLDPNLNGQESATLLGIYSRRTPYKLWEGELMKPVPGDQISTFGGIRNYNGGVYEGRHTGSDYRASTGDNVQAIGTGRVIYTGHLPVHGNFLAIDHGIGVISSYSHLSDIYVVPGQRVLKGEIVAAVGATGRVEGAHLHLEIAVNGLWVEPTQFMLLPVPEIVQDVRLGK